MNGKTTTIQFVTRTAVLLALLLLFQSLRVFFPALSAVPLGFTNLSTLLTGALVNMTLIIAAMTVGIWGASIISVLATVIAFLQGFLPPVPQMVIVVSLGNIIIALIYLLTAKAVNGKVRIPAAIILSSLAKFLFLWALVKFIVIPFFVAQPKIAGVLSAAFGVSQLVTALLGSFIASLILPSIQKSLSKKGD